ncbi:MAG: HU family DNA-binding protein [Christensenellaceae bacterium]|jgi:DNA-binding protein HU-beta|nr:HU family DNA-binding protein [Christensenellaceae bacterium]
MTKADFVAKYSEKLGLSKKGTEEVVVAFAETIVEVLRSGDEVVLPELGKFAVVKRAAHNARNPRTGETVKVPATLKPVFKAGKKFKDGILA